MAGQFYIPVVSFGLGAVAFWLGSAVFSKRARVRVEDAANREKLAQQEEIVLQKTAAFRALFEGFFGGAATLDDQGHILRSNRALGERLGYDADELRGCSLMSLIHPEDIEPVQDFLLSLVGERNEPSSSRHFASELRCYSKEGVVLWVHLSLSVLHDADFKEQSQAPQLLALMDDVTRRRQAEGVVARLSAGVHDLYRVIADQQSDLNSQMKALLNLGCNLFDVRTGVLGKVNGNQLEIMAVVSPDAGLRVGRSYELGKSAKRTELPAPLRGNDVSDWQKYPFVAMTQNETFLGSPIFVGGRFSGLLSFSDTHAREKPFESEQTQFCQLMALWIGSEIERRERQALREKQDADLLRDNARLEAMATEDALTGVKNRRAFDERLKSEFQRACQSGRPLSILMMDVDKFKQFNDSFGHPAGDEVLKKVGQLLQGGVRAGEFVARYGGEEFVVLLPDADVDAAIATAERLRTSIERAHWTHRAITASIGVASWTPAMTTTAQLVGAADGALYQSKGDGRNRVTHAARISAPL